MSKSSSARSPKRFSVLLGQPAKTDNSGIGLAAKVTIRENVMAAIDRPAVFDAFAGEGVLFHRVWRRAGSYVGCDLKWYCDERLMFVADNHRVMRAIDLSAFNVFDFDAWGSPWDHVLILAARRAAGEGRAHWPGADRGLGLEIEDGRLADWPCRLVRDPAAARRRRQSA
jgi:hypothetical protein